MRHSGFVQCVLLASQGVAFSEASRWSHSRREAALIVLAESKGGKFNEQTWQMDWPKP